MSTSALNLHSVEAYRNRDGHLRQQLEQWIPQYRQINEQILPRARFQPTDTNRGDKKFLAIVNNVAGLALRTAVAGLVANTSPVRPWFRLTTPDPDLAELGNVREWLHVVEERMRAVFAKSNIYQCLTMAYMDLLAYGTTLFVIDEDDETILRGYHAPIGSYRLACSERGRPDTAFRDLTFSVRQLILKFGPENASDRVRNLFKEGQYDQPIDVTHVVEPNDDHVPGSLLPREKPFRSCWYEGPVGPAGRMTGAGGSPGTLGSAASDKFLRESGLSEQRAIGARWMVIGDDVYGTNSPGMEALGDTLAVQAYEKVKAQVTEILAGPPTAVPYGMAHVSLLPRKITNMGQNTPPGQRPYALVEPNPQALAALEAQIGAHGQRINRTLYADLWQTLAMLEQTGGRQMTAEEVRARIEEKLVQLSPALLRQDDELLRPTIDTAFPIMMRAGLFPPPPQELLGVEVRVEFVSMLHQAQSIIQLGSVERLAGFVAQLAEGGRPDALDKLNIDKMVDDYARTLGVQPNLVLSDDEVQQVRATRQKQQAMAQAAGALDVGGKAAKNLASAPMDGDTALSRLVGLTGPVEPTGAAA